MYLSKLILNPNSRRVQKELGNIYEFHRSLMSAFPDNTSREKSALLYRMHTPRSGSHNGIMVLAQSMLEPNWQTLEEKGDYFLQSPQAKNVLHNPSGPQGHFRFYLRANPTRRNKETRKLMPLQKESQLADWLDAKGDQYGFKYHKESLLIRKMPPIEMFKSVNGKTMCIQIQSVDFSGALQVTNADKFNVAWQYGIGRGKSFGCGLLSLAKLST